MTRPRSLYRVLVPFGSRRDRCLWIAWVTILKLREGPGPWLRAVKKGVYQLLPTRWQQRVLRWSGKDQFFRREAVRHAGPAAGVEQPGLVSVVLPIYQQADMAQEAIDSVLAQTYEPFELIVVDDGSTDGLQDVLRPYLGDPRVRAVAQPNQGLPKALSTGFDHATGEFFTWTSADNRMGPEQLERLVGFLRERAGAAMVYADYELIGEDGKPLEGGEFRILDRTDKANLAIVRVNRSTHDLNRYEDNFVGPCFMYRGQVGRLLGDYNPELGLEDYDYWMRVNLLFGIEHLGTDEVFYEYRVHENTLSARARELKIAERAKVLMAYEGDRAAWGERPMQVVVSDDDALSDAIAPGLKGGDQVVAAPEGSGAKALHACRPEQLGTLSLGDQAAVACWFDDPEQVYQTHAWLRDLRVCAFASSEDVGVRLAVFSRTVFPGEPDPDTYRVARRFADNGVFFRTTRDAAKIQRAVPTPLAVVEPVRMLLQVDTFGKGGLERVVEDLAVELARLGCEVGVLALDGSEAATLPAEVERVVPASRSANAYEQALREGRWQVVQAHASTFGADVAARLSVPFVQVVHNSYVWFDRDQVGAYREADAATAAYVCVSAQALGYADLRLQLDVQKMLVIENGIEPLPQDLRSSSLRRDLGFADDDFVFLQVASIQPAKAHLEALRALARLRETHPTARLLCLGNDRMNPVHSGKVEAEAQRLGLGDAVVFAGHRDDAPACYGIADGFFLPSFWEGCSLAVWEAIRAGLPLVLADVGAAREQIRHGRGEVVAAPFDTMFALDATNLEAVVATEHAGYAERLAAAMARVMDQPSTGSSSGGLPHVAHRATMARRHLLLMTWLLQGGAVPGIRESMARAADTP